MVAKGLHGKHRGPLLDCYRHDLFRKRPEMRVHDIDRHLHRVETEAMLLPDREHAKMHRRVLMTGKPDVADLAGLTRGDRRFKRAAWRKDAVWVLHPNHLVKLDQINDIGLQSAERLLQLKVVGFFSPAVHLGHQEDLVAIPVTQRLAHSDLAD